MASLALSCFFSPISIRMSISLSVGRHSSSSVKTCCQMAMRQQDLLLLWGPIVFQLLLLAATVYVDNECCYCYCCCCCCCCCLTPLFARIRFGVMGATVPTTHVIVCSVAFRHVPYLQKTWRDFVRLSKQGPLYKYGYGDPVLCHDMIC